MVKTQLNYYINAPTNGERIFGIIGEYILTKTMTKRTRLLVYANTPEEAAALINKWRIGNIFKCDMRRVEDMHKVYSKLIKSDQPINTTEFFEKMREYADKTMNEPCAK